jgi:hypothetical protein
MTMSMTIEAVRKRERYALRKAAELCIRCGASLLPEWGSMCPECSEYDAERSRKYARSKRGLRLSRDRQRRYREENPQRFKDKCKDRYQAHKLAGICVKCSAPATDGAECAKHAEQHRASSAAYYAKRYNERRKDKSICLRCGKARDRDGALCEACCADDRRRATKRNKKRRAAWVRDGLCTMCGATRDRDGATCTACRVRGSESAKRDRAMRAAKGVCIRCGGNKAKRGLKQCAPCLLRIKEKRRAQKEAA